MILRASSAILIFLMPLVSFAAPGTSAFGVEQGSLEWKRAELEDFLTDRATKNVTDFIKADKFKIQVRVTFKEVSAQRAVTHVNVPLLGTVATLDNPDRPKPALGMFDRVAKVNVTLIVSDTMSEETAESMAKIIKQSIPVIKADKVTLELVRLEAPGLGFVGWIREFKYVLGAAFLLGLFLFGMRYILPHIRFQTAFKFGPAQQPAAPRAEAVPFSSKLHIPMMVPMEVLADEEHSSSEFAPEETKSTQPGAPAPGEELLDSLLPSTLATVELRRLRSLAMTLSIKECVELVLADNTLGSILVNLLPTEKTTTVLAQLPDYVLQSLKAKTLEWTSDSLAKNSAELMAAIQEFKGVSKPIGTERLRVFVEQVGPDEESQVYSELVRSEKFDQLAELCRRSPPAELVAEFPLEILYAVFERMGFREKAGVLFTCDKDLAERLCSVKSKDPVHVSLRQEVERLRRDKKSAEKAQTAWPKFVTKLREAMDQNPKWQLSVRSIVEHWLWEKSHGVVGQERPKGKKHGAA